MNTETITVANLKCSGCATTIRSELLKIKGVADVVVDVENGQIQLSYNNVDRATLIDKLRSLGYPEATEQNGSLLKLKSYSSCLIGRLKNT